MNIAWTSDQTTGPIAARKSLPMTHRDLRDLAKLTDDPAYRTALAHLGAEVSEDISESKMLHLLVRAALDAVQDRVAEDGYAAMAADEDYMAERRAISRRQRPARAE